MFFTFPVGMNYRTERLPVITFSLIAINTAIYLLSLGLFFSTQGESDIWIYQHFWLIPKESVWYTYLTSMFVHANIFHLLGNMIFLFLFGCCVEDMIGRGKFLAFYLLGGLLANFAYIAFSSEHFASQIPLGGASGAISVCLGMYLMLRTEADIEFKYFYFIWLVGIYSGAGEFEIPAWMAIGFWFIKDIFWMIWGFYFPSHGGVAFGAHAGGLLAGIVFIALLKLKPKPETTESNSSGILSAEEVAAAASINRTPAITEIPTIYLHAAGIQSGPFTLSQIQDRLTRQELGPETLYWTEGMLKWENVSELGAPSLK